MDRLDLRSARVMSAGRLRSAGEYCMNLVKQADFDNYLAGLLVPGEHRGAHFALRAFNVELASMKDQTHGNAIAGRIRFQWWRETIDSIYNGAGATEQQFKQQPVAYALSHYCRDMGLSRHWLERSLEARQRDLSQDHHETLDDLETYAEQGHSSILYLLLESMDVRNEQSNYMASHIGVCSGLTTFLRGFPHHVSKRQLYIPLELLRKNSLTAGQVLSGAALPVDASRALQDCVFEVASQAHGHLELARDLFADEAKAIPRRAIHICGPAVRSALYLKTLREMNFDPLHPDLQRNSQLAYQWKLLQMRFRKSL